MFAQAPTQRDMILQAAIPDETKDKLLTSLVVKGLSDNPSLISAFVNNQQPVDLGQISIDKSRSSIMGATPQSDMAKQPGKMSGLVNFMQSFGRGATGGDVDLQGNLPADQRSAGWQTRLGAVIGREFGNAALNEALYGVGSQKELIGKPSFVNDPSDFAKAASASAEKMNELAIKYGVNPADFKDQRSLSAAVAAASKEGTARDRRVAKQSEFANVAKLRGEFDDLSKDFYTVRDSLFRINASMQEPSAAGDIALVFNYMKMLDPRSVVRESEFATAQNAGNIPERVRGLYNSMLSKKGTRLSDNVRKDFYDTSRKLFAEQKKVHADKVKRYTALADKYGYDPEDIVTDVNVADAYQPSSQLSDEEAYKIYLKKFGGK